MSSQVEMELTTEDLTAVASDLAGEGWAIADVRDLPGRPGERLGWTDLELSGPAQHYLEQAVPAGIYRHQHAAVEAAKDGADVCLATGTSSGKSLAFQIAALERLAASHDTRVLALYPLVALATEQETRWRQAITASGLDVEVCRIDGRVPTKDRALLLRKSRVVVATPDILHAWMLPRVGESAIQRFLARLGLVVIDEVHNYTGVFGSNAAFLFRRLQHAVALLGGELSFVGASATITDPHGHLNRLVGRSFRVVDAEADSSPRQPVHVALATPPDGTDLLGAIAECLEELARRSIRFLCFVDSRKQTEHIGAVLARGKHPADEDDDGSELDDSVMHKIDETIEELDVLPYRAGYEERDRERIQARLSDGTLGGVVSTSALELGIDIPHLDACVLVGVPRSATSLHQRIGRIGRHRPGLVLTLNRRDVYDEAVFRDPDRFLNRPLSESAMYLENPRIQYIHALCLARAGGEHDQITGDAEQDFKSPVVWPEGFTELCAAEREGSISRDLQIMKAEAGDSPQYAYPLRDVETQFNVELKQGPRLEPLGSMSYSQLLREAYPGAIYRYLTRAYRITRVDVRGRVARAREEKSFFTRPQMLPTTVFPDLASEEVYRSLQRGSLNAIECNAQVRQAICGYRERRGPNEIDISYPTDGKGGIYFSQPYFSRTFFTSAALLAHPALGRPGVNNQAIAEAVFEAFMVLVPFERRDLDWAADRFRTDHGDLLPKDSRFLALHDQTYGSLRLSGRLLDHEILPEALAVALEITADDNMIVLDPVSRDCLALLAEEAKEPAVDLVLDFDDRLVAPSEGSKVSVIRPGQAGSNVLRGNEEFTVISVFFNPMTNQLSYRGITASNTRAGMRDVLPVDKVVPIPGQTELGTYDMEVGDFVD